MNQSAESESEETQNDEVVGSAIKWSFGMFLALVAAGILIWLLTKKPPEVVVEKAGVTELPTERVKPALEIPEVYTRLLFEVSLYSSMMSRAVRDEPEWVVQVADQMEGVLPQRRGELIEVAQQPRKVNKGQNASAEKVTSVDRSVIMSPQLLFFDPPKDGPVRDSSSPLREVSLPAGKPVPLRTAELSKDVTSPKEPPKSSEK